MSSHEHLDFEDDVPRFGRSRDLLTKATKLKVPTLLVGGLLGAGAVLVVQHGLLSSEDPLYGTPVLFDPEGYFVPIEPQLPKPVTFVPNSETNYLSPKVPYDKEWESTFATNTRAGKILTFTEPEYNPNKGTWIDAEVLNSKVKDAVIVAGNEYKLKSPKDVLIAQSYEVQYLKKEWLVFSSTQKEQRGIYAKLADKKGDWIGLDGKATETPIYVARINFKSGENGIGQ